MTTTAPAPLALSEESRKRITEAFPMPEYARGGTYGKDNPNPRESAAFQFMALCERLANESRLVKENHPLPDIRRKQSALKKLQEGAAALLELGPDVLEKFDEALPSEIKVHWSKDETGKPKATRVYGWDILEAVRNAAGEVLATPKRQGKQTPKARLGLLRDIVRCWEITTGRDVPKTDTRETFLDRDFFNEASPFDICTRCVFQDLFPDVQLVQTFKDDIEKIYSESET